MFFGGKYPALDDKAKVEPPDLVFRMCWYLKENDKHGHFARSIKRFCKRVGLIFIRACQKYCLKIMMGAGMRNLVA